jgi:hypothetical protein
MECKIIIRTPGARGRSSPDRFHISLGIVIIQYPTQDRRQHRCLDQFLPASDYFKNHKGPTHLFHIDDFELSYLMGLSFDSSFLPEVDCIGESHMENGKANSNTIGLISQVGQR